MKRQLVLLGAFGIFVWALSARSAEPAAAPTGFRAEFIAEADSVGKKLTDLANAMPQEKYSWRPAPGIRSVSEVYVHVAGAGYLIPSFLGVKIPEGITRDMEKTVTEKARVLDTLKKSLEHVKSVAANMSDADLDKKVKIFGGREVTQRAVMVLILNHMHEHLGQSIAYARMNGVAPPWSEGGEPAPAKKS
ncbi:MAG TPA: DinB family protein [Thermoanaerobaculia bacterium]|nr:DinB family protein [Thermoanaerobaculia bacterium]